ncbi:MAG: PQQ-dependent dehydrogenase, methanol/ethanol family [Desulfobacterales bacterium]
MSDPCKAIASSLAAIICLATVPATGQEEMQVEYDVVEMPSHWVAPAPTGKGAGPVTEEMLRKSGSYTDKWLQYHGDDRGYRHSPIKALTPEKVKNLRLAGLLPTGTLGQQEVSPVVYDGIIYVTTSYNRLFALESATGKTLWRYDHQNPKDLRLCCGPPNRGVAIYGNTVLMATLDAHLLAFDRRTGALLWNRKMADYDKGYSATSAPLIVKGMAVIGIAGGEFGVRGFFDAYDVKTGELVWRHYTVPAAGEPGVETWAGESWKTGGAPAWTTGLYDAETDTLFWTTGNPSPDWNGDSRKGDNLYSNSLLAVEPETGKLKWHFQFTPHDLWDYDGNTHIFLLDFKQGNKVHKVVAQPNRNGYFYVIDRQSGEFLRGNAYLEQVNWATLDAKGRPIVSPHALPTESPTERVCPSNAGGINGAWTAAYNPDLNLAFIPAMEACSQFQKGLAIYMEGLPYTGGTFIQVDGRNKIAYGHITAYDVAKGEVSWRYHDPFPVSAGALSTAGGVVFSGSNSGAIALDARSGEKIWSFNLGAPIRSQPIAWQEDGKTYVAYGAGDSPSLAAMFGAPTHTSDGGLFAVFVLE